ncbi:MAG: hypothetical protein WCK49_07430 [Myxococcaceae bacterium]
MRDGNLLFFLVFFLIASDSFAVPPRILRRLPAWLLRNPEPTSPVRLVQPLRPNFEELTVQEQQAAWFLEIEEEEQRRTERNGMPPLEFEENHRYNIVLVESSARALLEELMMRFFRPGPHPDH